MGNFFSGQSSSTNGEVAEKNKQIDNRESFETIKKKITKKNKKKKKKKLKTKKK